MATFKRNLGVDALRGMAIFLVLGLHYFDLSAFYTAESAKSSTGIYRIFGHGYFGVNIFFVISGFLIASTSVEVDRNGQFSIDAARFYVRRATRILPLLLVTLLLGALAARLLDNGGAAFRYLIDTGNNAFTLGFWASIATFSFNWFRLLNAGPVPGWFGLQWDLLWSLAVEEQFYVLFPWVIMAVRTVRRARLVAVAVIGVAALVRAVMIARGFDWLPILTNSVNCFDALAIGVGVALSKPWSPRASIAAGVVGSAGALATYVAGYQPLFGLTTLGMGLSTGLLIQATRGGVRLPSLAVLPGRVLGELGRVSYGAYLLHALVLLAIGPFILGMDKFAGLAIAVVATYVVAKISFMLFERPVELTLRRVSFARLPRSGSTMAQLHPARGKGVS